ncbi:MAG: hypothetical protein ABJ360_12375 [Roseobacter sp.]
MRALNSPALQRSENLAGPYSDSSVLMQRASMAGHSKTPGETMAQGSAMLGELGMTAHSMSNDEYSDWSGTFQCKMGMHGKAQIGGRTIVTQYKSAQDAAQFAGFFKRNKEKFAAGLVMAEAALTITAAILGITTGSATGAVPIIVGSAIGLGSGVVKLIRGIIMMQQADKDPADKNQTAQKWIAGLRTVEAILAGIAILVGNPLDWKKIPAMIFVIAKLVRSIEMGIIVKLKTEPNTPENQQKIDKAKRIAKIAHWFEVGALAVTGAVGIGIGATADAVDASDALKLEGMQKAGGLALGIGASKAVRASGVLDKKPGDNAPRAQANAVDQQAPLGRPRAGAIDEGAPPSTDAMDEAPQGRARANAMDLGQPANRPRSNAIDLGKPEETELPAGRPRANAVVQDPSSEEK